MSDSTLIDLATRFISQLGFPIFVAVWLLVRTDKLLSSLNVTLQMVQSTMQALLGEISATHEAMRSRSREPD